MAENTWIGVDLDGTLAMYEGWKGPTHIGPPIPAMIRRVQDWLAKGIEVRVFTARVSARDPSELAAIYEAVKDWTRQHVGTELIATCIKDFACIAIYDDRAFQVERNTGRVIREYDALDRG